MIHYILQIIVFQLLFLVIYDVFLKKETFFTWNRVYLLLTPILSFVLPFIKISAIRETIPSDYIVRLPEVFIGDTGSEIALHQRVLEETVIAGSDITSSISWMTILWFLGVTVSLVLFAHKMLRIQRLKQTGNRHKEDGVYLVVLPKTDTAFSFFNTIFLGEALSEKQKENILLHENIHIKERHSLDMLFFEILRIVCWFNPLVYIYQNKMMMLQEYTVDAKVASQKNKKEYYQGLLSQVFQTENISFINPFFNHSIIKKRIVMLQKTKSKQILKAKYLFLLPALFSILVYTACTDANAKEGSYNASESEVIKNIEILKNSIAKQGNLSEEEERALKVLHIMTAKDGIIDDTHNDVLNDLNIPFGVIHKAPMYPGCENLSNDKAKTCFSQKLSQFVSKEFDASIAKNNGLTGNQKVYVQFKIDNTGQVTDIKADTDNPILQAEAERVAAKLPKMTPGEQDGKKVSVIYNLPISLNIK